jgi:hypothetical protein
MRKAYQSDLSDAGWICLEPHLPAPKATGRPRIYPLREILDAIFYVLKSGCAWGDSCHTTSHLGRPSTTTSASGAWTAPGRGCTPPCAITGVINRMERMGYARREKYPDYGRWVDVRPVPEELERAGADVFGSYERRALDGLVSEYDERDLALFLDLMRRSNDMTEEEIARIRAASAEGDEGVFAAALGSVGGGRLVFANGASRLTLRVGTGMEDLYRARFEGTPRRSRYRTGP